ncbi:MAG TPA: hypothetical protein VHM30_06620 [Gemmatimonadaceae bacterium]|nr:hypothetical protein [Gemmatimonadaceae bacterium]
MSADEFARALRNQGAPLFLDDAGTPTALGIEFAATTADGTAVRVTRLAPVLTAGLRDPDAFVRIVERHGYRGAGITGSWLYVVEPPPAGIPLAQRLAGEGTIPPTQLAPLAGAATAALTAHHARFGPHGLISPSTLLVDGAGGVTLRWSGIVPGLRAAGADLARFVEQLDVAGLLAPELESGSDFSVRSDVYALGATFYLAATGKPPFGGRTTAGVMAAVLTEDGGASTSPARRVTSATLRAIEHDPGDRWNDARHFHDAIVGTPSPAIVPTVAKPRRWIGWAVAAVTVTILLVWRLTH